MCRPTISSGRTRHRQWWDHKPAVPAFAERAGRIGASPIGIAARARGARALRPERWAARPSGPRSHARAPYGALWRSMADIPTCSPRADRDPSPAYWRRSPGSRREGKCRGRAAWLTSLRRGSVQGLSAQSQEPRKRKYRHSIMRGRLPGRASRACGIGGAGAWCTVAG